MHNGIFMRFWLRRRNCAQRTAILVNTRVQRVDGCWRCFARQITAQSGRLGGLTLSLCRVCACSPAAELVERCRAPLATSDHARKLEHGSACRGLSAVSVARGSPFTGGAGSLQNTLQVRGQRARDHLQAQFAEISLKRREHDGLGARLDPGEGIAAREKESAEVCDGSERTDASCH